MNKVLEMLQANPGVAKKIETLAKSLSDNAELTPKERTDRLISEASAIAAKVGVMLNPSDFELEKSNISDRDLEAVSGGVNGCAVGAGVQTGICAVGAFFTAGVTGIASLITVGGMTVASACLD